MPMFRKPTDRARERTPEERERERAERVRRRLAQSDGHGDGAAAVPPPLEPTAPTARADAAPAANAPAASAPAARGPSVTEPPVAAAPPPAAAVRPPATPAPAPAPSERRHQYRALLARRKRRTSVQRSRGAHSWRGRTVALLALALAAALIWFLVSLFEPFHGSGDGRVAVDIPPHSSASKVGSILAHDGVVASGFFFELRAVLSGKRSDLRSGHFVLARDMSYAAAIDALTKAPPVVPALNVLVPEGYTRLQIASLAHADGLAGSYLAASTRSSLLRASAYGVPRHTRSLEGFLFPATYELRRGSTAAQLVADQLAAFKLRFGAADIAAARALGTSPYEALIVASMVQREAALPHDRPLVAAVIYNRLHDKMPLGIDSTLRYALNDYSEPLTAAQLSLNTPYNTRLHRGLPPTPIANPGSAAIAAALHPAHVPYLYFVVKPCGNGAQVFTSSYSAFLADEARYAGARAKRGGRAPNRC